MGSSFKRCRMNCYPFNDGDLIFRYDVLIVILLTVMDTTHFRTQYWNPPIPLAQYQPNDHRIPDLKLPIHCFRHFIGFYAFIAFIMQPITSSILHNQMALYATPTIAERPS
eukprot:718379_1